MKNISLLLLFIVSFYCIQTKAQQPIDTLTYVKQFEINKANYIGQPLSHLLNDMTEIQPQTVNSLPQVWRQDLTPYSIFNFSEIEKQYGKVNVTIYITWQNPISRSQAFTLSKQNHFLFTNDEKSFYGNKIIKDINVYRR